jgi:hypothetical protein
MREGQAAKHAFSRRAAVRITRGGPARILIFHASSRSRRVDPSWRRDATRGEPSFAIIFGDPDRARTKFDDRRPFADGNHAFKVAYRAAHPLGELLFRDDSVQFGDSLF